MCVPQFRIDEMTLVKKGEWFKNCKKKPHSKTSTLPKSNIDIDTKNDGHGMRTIIVRDRWFFQNVSPASNMAPFGVSMLMIRGGSC